MRLPVLGPTAAIAVIALLASGCGLLGSPSMSSSDEVVAAMVAMRGESMRMRATVDLNLDEGELRAAIRADESVLELFYGTDSTDADTAMAKIAKLKAEADRHALLLAIGDDGSASFATESDGTVWAEVQTHSGFDATGEPVQAFDLDVNVKVDWDFLATQMQDSSMTERIEAASVGIGAIAPELVTQMPSLEPLLDMATAFLTGEQAGVSGTLDMRAWLDMLAPYTGGMFDLVAMLDELDPTVLDVLALQPADYAKFFVFESFRLEDGLTLVDVSIKARAAAEAFYTDFNSLLDTQTGLSEMASKYDSVVAQIPELLTNAATISFDGAAMTEMRFNLFDIAVQIGVAKDPDDPKAQAMSKAREQLTETGMFLTMAFSDVGNVGSVRAIGGTTLSWEQLRAVVGDAAALYAPLLRDIDAARSSPDSRAVSEDTRTGDAFGYAPAIAVRDVTPGQCFDDTGLYGDVAEGPRVFSCSQPHDNEVFGLVELVGDRHSSAVLGAYDACTPLFTSWVGIAPVDSVMYFSTLDPTLDEFAAGARSSACYLFGFEPSTGSAAGSGR
ncbi:MAG: hypothetical protein ACJA2H_000807 [Nitriliruptoraceae bacterium]|jgi:hypothetical protein